MIRPPLLEETESRDSAQYDKIALERLPGFSATKNSFPQISLAGNIIL